MTKIQNSNIPKEVVLEKASIDSFRIYTPLLLIGRDNVHESILDNLITVNETTGEEIHVEKNKLKIDCNGFSMHAYIRVKHNRGSSEEQLVILLSSKYHESSMYFDGITESNFPNIFKNLVSKGVISSQVDYSNFLKISSVTDVDIKQDFRVPIDEWNMIRKATKEFKRLDGVAAMPMYNGGNGNLGFQFNHRNKSTAARPFLKGYSKEVELNTKSKEFKNKYLKDIDLTDLRRIEVQVKDKKHFVSFGVESNSLESILNLSVEKLHEIQCRIFDKYKPISFKEEKTRFKVISLNVKEQFIYDVVLNQMSEKTLSFSMASDWALNMLNVSNRKKKYSFKKTLKKLASHYSINGFNLLSNSYSYAAKTKIFQHYNLI